MGKTGNGRASQAQTCDVRRIQHTARRKAARSDCFLAVPRTRTWPADTASGSDRRAVRSRISAASNSDDFGSMNLFGSLVPLSTAGQPSSVKRIGFERGSQAVGDCWRTPFDPVVMGQRPPASQILVAIDPRLSIAAVRNRQAPLRRRTIGRVIVPVEPFPTRDVRHQVVQIVDRTPGCVGVILTVAPIRQRHVVVDPDEVDVGISPERIEVKIVVPRLRLIAEVFRPIRRIAQS